VNESSSSGAELYRRAGVDLSSAEDAVARIRRQVRATFTPRVESEIGAFAGFFAYPEAGSERLLVSSMDGVGTKLKIAARLGRWHGVGYDIVSHCVNDILVHGATPIFFLDYIGAGRLSADVVEELVRGMSEACLACGCALIGGETAEMPGMYSAGELDLVGTIVGEVTRSALVNGSRIEAGDRILGLRSTGLHTNGYSLARRVLQVDEDPDALGTRVPDTDQTIADQLLQSHRMYLPLVRPLLGTGLVHGMAHITGGGVFGNLVRVLPPGTRARLRRDAWPRVPIFELLRTRGGIDEDECHRVFNMGIGYLLVVSREDETEVTRRLQAGGEAPILVGEIESGEPSVQWAE
jgi:phosphoribosylformylglycinamidine cyclo-ligase